MRTKTLLLTAALSAAGLAMTQAQSVFSVNIVGYVNIDAPAGFSMMANPLDNGAGNKISDLFANTPDGSIIYKYVNNQFTINVYDAIDGWSDLTQTMNPGEGAFLRLPVAATLTFVGEVKVGNLSNPLPQGFSIKSSQVPQAGALETDLKFPPVDGDVIYTFSNTAGYSIFVYDAGWDPSEPTVAVGEAYWVRKIAAGSWDRTFTVN